MSLNAIVDEKIPSRLHMVPAFVASVVKKLRDIQIDEDTLFDLKLCLHEAVVNAVKHGNKEKSDLTVHVLVKVSTKEITMEISDQGQGFDFNKIPNPTTEDNIGKLHGRGVYLILHSMDHVRFLNKGRTIKMVKALRQE
ncbi:MAG: ATP-binding protein [Candidatus Omnitrophica bacterium]|nr:ATP-binding protein [Candidatus Omnitrophota bacterium]